MPGQVAWQRKAHVPTLYSTLACPLLLAHPFPPKTVHTFHSNSNASHTLHVAATSSSLPDRRTFPVPMHLILYAPHGVKTCDSHPLVVSLH